MSRKHNVRKTSSPSRYKERLEARGLSPAQVRMPFIDKRRRKHDSFEAIKHES